MINIKKSLYGIVLAVFIFQVVKFYSFYLEYSVWQYADWVINYQAGFVRRGLIGEILFRIYQLTSIDLDFLILAFVILIIMFSSYFLMRSIKYVAASYINLLIFFSPGFFLYSIMNSQIIGRKDILMIFVMGFFVFFEKKLNNKNLFLIFIFSIIILCLSHSGFLFYTPYLLFLYLLIKFKRNQRINNFEIFLTLSTLFLILMLIIFNQGTEFHTREICQSVKNYVSDKCTLQGQIHWLQHDYERYMYEKKISGIDYLKSFYIYAISFVLVYFFLGIKAYKSKFNINYYYLNKINPLFIFIILFIPTIPTYILGTDWGRYIFISYSSSFFIFLYCLKENLIFTNYELKLNKYFFTTIIVFYSFFWTFPFYNATKFKFVLQKPVLSILKYIK